MTEELPDLGAGEEFVAIGFDGECFQSTERKIPPAGSESCHHVFWHLNRDGHVRFLIE